MSRLWDTSEFYARSEADELLRDFPRRSVAYLAGTFLQLNPAYEQDPQFASEIVTELRRRAVAGVRFWPEHPGLGEVEFELRTIIEAKSAIADDQRVGLQDQGVAEAPEFWWQKM